MILNKIKQYFWNTTNRDIYYEKMDKELKAIWTDFSLKMLKELQKVRHSSENRNWGTDNSEEVKNFWLTFCKEGGKVFGVKRCEDCSNKLKDIK